MSLSFCPNSDFKVAVPWKVFYPFQIQASRFYHPLTKFLPSGCNIEEYPKPFETSKIEFFAKNS